MLKILAISNLYPPYYIGGYELGCKNVVDELRRRGHFVHVLTSSYGVPRPLNEGHVLRQLLIYRYEPTQILSKGKPRLMYMEWWNNAKLSRLIRTLNPDVVFIWNLRGLSMSLLVTARRLGAPMVYLISDTWLIEALEEDEWFNLWNYVPEDPLKAVAKRALQGCGLRRIVGHYIPTSPDEVCLSNLCFVSEDLRRQYLERGLSVEDSFVIRWGVDMDRFRPERREFNAKLLFCGRLTQDKGVHLAIEAVAHLIRRGHKKLRLTIVGEGPGEYKEWLNRLVFEKDIEQYVSFRGKVPSAQMPKIYNGHDILLFTSIWREPLSMVILEAMACGMVVVGARVGGSQEIFEDGVNCLIFEPGNAFDLADKIEYVLKSPELRHKLREGARKTVSERFSLKGMVDKVEEVLYRAAVREI